MKKRFKSLNKKVLSWLLVGSMVIGLAPITVFTSSASDEIPNAKGEYMTETDNIGDMNRVPYNNEDLIVDLGGSAFSTIIVADANEDGAMDLIQGSNSTPSEGVKIFYGKPNSQDNTKESEYLLMDKGRWLRKNTMIFGTPIYGNDGNYERTVIVDGVWGYGDAVNYPSATAKYNYEFPKFKGNEEAYSSQVVDGVNCDKFDTIDGSQSHYSFADYDGDGLLDLILSVGSWDDFAWKYHGPAYYNEDGIWDPDGDGKEEVVHGWVFWHKNLRNAQDYEGQELSETIAVQDGVAPTWGAPEVVKVYDYVVDENDNKIIDEESGVPLDVRDFPQAQFRDWDNDGDQDIICGSFINEITYFENVAGTDDEMPIYVKGRKLVDTDGNEIYAEHMNLSITSAKWNTSDDLWDLIVIEEDARVFLLENTGELDENNTPIMKKAQYFQQPADSLKIGMMSTPTSVDWDGDTDEDIIAGDSAGFLSFVENLTVKLDENGNDIGNGNWENPSWNKPVRLTNPEGEVYHFQAGYLGSIQGPIEKCFGYTQTSVADWDGDGTLDIMTNNSTGVIYWHRGIPGQPYMVEDARHVEVEWENGPKIPAWYNYDWRKDVDKELVTQWRTTPYMIDLPIKDLNGDGIAEGDRLVDLVMLDHEGYLAFFERYQDADGTLKLKEGKRIFKDTNGDALRMNADTDGRSGRITFTIADWDQDGHLDLLCKDDVCIKFVENQALKSGEYVFAPKAAGDTVHSRQLEDHNTTPTTCDWNKDGVPDLLLGAEDGVIYYMLNNFVEEETGEEDPGQEDTDNLDNYLTAHWDFEDDPTTPENEALLDKATEGETNNLSYRNQENVTVSDGVAQIASNGALTTGDSDDLQLINSAGATIFMRVKLSTLSSWCQLFAKYNSGGYGYGMRFASGQTYDLNFSHYVSSGGTRSYTNNSPMLVADEWREVAITSRYNENGNLVFTYYVSKESETSNINDYIVYEIVTDRTNIWTAVGDFVIGNINAGEDKSVVRSFDDVRIYQKALTAEELAGIIQDQSAQDALVAHWDFEDDANTESSEALLDKAPNGERNNLSYRNEVNITVSDGVAQIASNGALTTGNSDDLQLINSAGATIFMRVKLSSIASWCQLFEKVDTAGYGYGMRFASGQTYDLNFYHYVSSGGTRSYTNNSPMLVADEWREVAITSRYNENGNLVFTYYVSKESETSNINDYIVYEIVTDRTNIWTAVGDFVIGNTNAGEDKSVVRSFDDVRIYQKALTAEELVKIIPSATGEPEEPVDPLAQNLVAHWDFNGDVTHNLNDKATGGAQANNLGIELEDGVTDSSVVTIADGIATIKDGGYLKTGNASDLNQAGEHTIFVRVKIENTQGTGRIGLVTKNSDGHYALSLTSDKNNYLAFSITNGGDLYSSAKGIQMPSDVWKELAVVVSENGDGTFTYEMFMSKNSTTGAAGDFESLGSIKVTPSGTTVNSNDLIIGDMYNGMNERATGYFDDVRIYNTALTTEQLAEIIPDYANMERQRAHWDFSGANETEALKDKSEGEVSDDLSKVNGNNVSIDYANGIATITGNGALKALDSDDLDITGKMTIFLRMYVDENFAGTLGIVEKGNDYSNGNKYALPYSMKVVGGDAAEYTVNYDMYFDNIYPYHRVENTSGLLAKGAWREVAIIVDKNENGYLTYEYLVSKNTATAEGDDFVSVYKRTTPYEDHFINSADLFLGNTTGTPNSAVTRKFDDIQIYNYALTADELAALLPADLGTTGSNYLKSLDNDAYIPFAMHRTSYVAETKAATVTMSPVADDANATVTIKLNGETISSVENQALAVGENVFTFTVSEGGNERTYTVSITRIAEETKSADELSAEITDAQAITNAGFSASSWDELQNAITNAQSALEGDEADRIAASKALQVAIRELTSDMRRVDLQALVTEVTGTDTAGQVYADMFADYLEQANSILAMKVPSSSEIKETYAILEAVYNKIAGLDISDVNLDKKSDVRDLVAILKVEKAGGTDDVVVQLAIDVDGNKAFDKKDIVAIRRKLVGQ